MTVAAPSNLPAAEGRTPPRILALPALVANQIAAGEVVERPSSVVKELVENSLDAKASRVSLELELGGIELIRVTDDGVGILPDDFAMAVAPHATSKIADAADLDHIATLGFRGEALASIASVSRMTLRSRVAGHDQAWQMDVEGATTQPLRPAAGPVGTSVTVRNLFFNTPARRKFLRTAQTEKERCVDAFHQIALAHPGVAFTLIVDGKSTLDLPPNQSPRERALGILGKELDAQLVMVQADRFDDARGMSLWGLAGLPALARGSTKGQFLFVNGRPVRDRTVQHAVSEAYRGLIEPGRYPTVVLMMELSPEGVDVNVHPQKAEVRFRDSSMVHSVVLRALREALQRADLTPAVTALRPGIAWSPTRGDVNAVQPGLMGAGDLGAPGAGLPGTIIPGAGITEAKFASFFSRFRPDVEQLPLSLADGDRTHAVASAPVVPSPVAPVDVPAATPPAPTRLLQVHNSYVITQDEQGVVIIDQHALHERAMFEYLLQRVGSGSLESQHLLAPIPVRVSKSQAAALGVLQPLLARIGVEAEDAGAAGVLVRAFPSFLFERGVDIVDFVEELLRKADAGEIALGGGTGDQAFEHALRDVLDMMSCKAAIKAGDRLSDLELADLVQLREDVERSSNCPHGRPTSIRLTLRELEKLFGRS
ncbi:MAG TPA: DNA mismatch repair endonuclease MutL [Phycisphaerales bacterium]|nr:DNA mismatch repair endonuclease MutL [Phycisphaerales bacterium]